MMAFSIILIVFGSCFIPVSLSQKINYNYENLTMPFEGQILYSPMYSGDTYLLENTGALNHTWPSGYMPGVMVRWLGDGSILRTIRVGVGPGGGGAGGGVQIMEWDGTVIWDYRYNTNGVLSHHDVRSLPNGNVLLIAWETKTRAEAIDAGKNPNYVGSQGLMPDHIIEVEPTAPSSGNIVWEWHVWDHLIQDYDSSKKNYGVVGDHPELVDINYAPSSGKDWMHSNSIDYNEEFDQILVSVCYLCEIWVIDHSTTTEEAAGHTGGNSGKGGDLLYRWGNPQAYDAGSSSDQKLFRQHDASWIDEGCPGEGNILVFNNGQNRPSGQYSTVDEIEPPVNENGEYYLEPDNAYGPETQTWLYNPQPSFYAKHLSGATRIASGNTLICNGETGKLWEVTIEGATVWQYTLGVVDLFKIDYIYPEEQQPPEPDIPDLDCSGSLSWTNIKPGATVNGSFLIQNIGGLNSSLNWTVNTSLINWGIWTFNPDSGINLSPDDGQMTIQVSVIAPNEQDSEFECFIKVENQDNSSDFDLVPVYLKTPKNINVFKSPIYQFILKFKNLYLELVNNLFKAFG
jgi:hypothetical protein